MACAGTTMQNVSPYELQTGISGLEEAGIEAIHNKTKEMQGAVLYSFFFLLGGQKSCFLVWSSLEGN